jgi:predicted dienelactone hydrolase
MYNGGMRSIEILIVLLPGLYLVWPQSRPLAIRLLPATTVILIFVHLAVEGYRWQMVPLYILTALLAVFSLLKLNAAQGMPASASSLTLILLAVSTLLPILLPVPRLGKPSGPHDVGTMTFGLTDDSRRELYSGRDEPRRFMVQVWYPAGPKPEDKRAPWMERADIYGPAISEFLEMPAFFLDHLALVRTPAYKDAQSEPSSSGYPVIIFSHGWNGFAAQNSGQAIELASHGYVVAATQHTYGAITTVFPDGSIAPNNPDALPEDAPDDIYDPAARLLVEQWSGDISFVLDFLNEQNQLPGSTFHTVLDLEHIGMYGHSTGGGAVIQFCGTDERCDALLALDPFMTPVSLNVLAHGIPQPAFFMFSQSWAGDTDSKNNRLFNQFYDHISVNKGVTAIAGTTHHDFSDLPLLSPVAAQLGLKGPIPGSRMAEIAETYLLSFFDATLKGRPSTLFDGAAPEFPEVEFMN